MTERARIALYDLRVGNFVGGFWRRNGVLNVSKFDSFSRKLCYHVYSNDGFCSNQGWQFENKRIGNLNKGKFKPKKTKGFPSESWIQVVDYRFPEQRNCEMQLKGQIHVNDVDIIKGGKGLLIASNIGVQMWNVSEFNKTSFLTKKANKSSVLTTSRRNEKKKIESPKQKNFLKKQTTKLHKSKKKNTMLAKKTKEANVLGSGASPCQVTKAKEKVQIENMDKSGNPKLNFSTKYNFDFDSKQKNDQEYSKNNKSESDDLVLLSSIQKNESKRHQDSQVQYSFPLKSSTNNQKPTMNYLKAEHRVTGFEKNICEINGKWLRSIFI
jgi:hypothetical protein